MVKKEIAEIRKLAQKKYRTEQRLFVAEGVKAIGEIVNAGFDVGKFYYTSQCNINLLPKGAKAELISESEMEKISFLQTATSLLATIKIPADSAESSIPSSELCIVLDNIQDPGNLGTIIRLADWFGINHIFCSGNTVDCYNPKVVQSTMGAIGRVRVAYCNLEPLIEDAIRRGIPIYGTFMEGDNIYTANLTPTGALVMGNEGSGISPELGKLVSKKITIPSFKKANVESLNVAIATSICCSEFRRRL